MMRISYAIGEENKLLAQKVPDKQYNAVLYIQGGEQELLRSFSSCPLSLGVKSGRQKHLHEKCGMNHQLRR